ncbi:MAG: type II secretion system protein [Pseudomonadota bacterium]
MNINAKKAWGFSLIELIGVLAIMAILASAIAPRVLDDIKRTRQDKETQQLDVLRDHLQTYILDNKAVPNLAVAQWTSAIASMASVPVSKVEFNERNFRRGYFVDPRFLTSTDTPFSGFTQQGGLSNPPVSPRIMLVSDLTGNAPNPPTTTAEFNAIWDQTAGASIVESSDVKISRLNLRGVFHRVILTNEQSAQTSFRLEDGSLNGIPAAGAGGDGVVTRYVINNTQISLYADPFPGGALDEVFIADDDKNFAYQFVSSQWVWQRP